MTVPESAAAVFERVLGEHVIVFENDGGDYGGHSWFECSCDRDNILNATEYAEEADHRAHVAAQLATALAQPDTLGDGVVREFVAYVERKWLGGTGHTANNRWVSHTELRKHAEAFAEEQAIWRQADEQCPFDPAQPSVTSEGPTVFTRTGRNLATSERGGRDE